ncbi:hypothetical protein [Streptomyces sp. NBC_01445]|uniref:hypothetical protein n=1 Tax=Streptomyces sp. NBC_01445 TaxID=2903869 RepID=UPI002DD8D7FA|nr:hypothetical protein [Streptomyces sp. NBC_01445]WSE03030.1 hypothetical protein OG574_06295 [Streptomyces sp. NBC_01445]
MDRQAGADLEVARVQFVLDGFVVGAGEAAGDQRPGRDALGTGTAGSGRDDAVSDLLVAAADLTGHLGRGVSGPMVTGVARKQRPSVAGHRQGGDAIPQRPTLCTVDKKVTTAGRPDAVGV